MKLDVNNFNDFTAEVVNGHKIIAQSKRFIKDYNCVCDEQFDGIYV